MSIISRIKNTGENNKNIVKNICGSFAVKGLSMVLNLFTIPAYMRYFADDAVLGVWFTIVSVINWVLVFDLGIGNGLRNKLPFALANKDFKSAREYISSAYISIFILSAVLLIVFFMAEPLINWNEVLNIEASRIDRSVLSVSIKIVFAGIMCKFVLGIINSILYAVQKPAVNNLLVFLQNFIIFIYVAAAPDMGMEKNLITLSYVNVIATNAPLAAVTAAVFSRELKSMFPRIKYFAMDKAKDILRIGLVLLWLQAVWMIVSSTHSFLITRLSGPEAVVEYQVYYKLFNIIASVFALAMTPIWSAVTKAQAEGNYIWIRKINNILTLFSIGTFVIDIIFMFFMQTAVNIWLGENAIEVNMKYAFVMSIFNAVFVLHNANTSVSNGLSEFKVQNIFMGIAALLMIPLAVALSRIMGSWTGVVLASAIAVLPYEIIQLIWTRRYLRKVIENN